MKILKYTLAALVLAGGANSFAQTNSEPAVQVVEEPTSSIEQQAAKKTAVMVEKLSLTDAQEERVRILNLKVAKKIDVIKNDASMTDEKKKEFIAGNLKDHYSVMKAILTADQLTTYDQWLEESPQLKKAPKTVTE